MPYSALVVALLSAVFMRVFYGQLEASSALFLAAFSVVFLWVFRAVVPRVNSRCYPTLLALFFCVE